jgi:hypothetical protein
MAPRCASSPISLRRPSSCASQAGVIRPNR